MSLKASAPVPPLRERSHYCAASIDSTHASLPSSATTVPSPSLPISASASMSSWRRIGFEDLTRPLTTTIRTG